MSPVAQATRHLPCIRYAASAILPPAASLCRSLRASPLTALLHQSARPLRASPPPLSLASQLSVASSSARSCVFFVFSLAALAALAVFPNAVVVLSSARTCLPPALCYPLACFSRLSLLTRRMLRWLVIYMSFSHRVAAPPYRRTYASGFQIALSRIFDFMYDHDGT